MSRIAELCQRVAGLEGKRQRAVLVKALTTYAADVERVRIGLSAANSATLVIQQAFGPDASTHLRAKLRESSLRAARVSSTLARNIRENPAHAGTNDGGNSISDLKEVAGAARKAVLDGWTKALTDRCALLGARLAVAAVAGSPRAAAVRLEVERMATTPFPESEPPLKKVVEFFARAEREVGAAGASEKLSRWVESAMRGAGSARDLQDPELRAFLDEHQLWARLTVKLT